MNRLEVQEIYDRLKEPKSVDYIEFLGFKSGVFNDFFGIVSVENISDTDAYIKVWQKLESLCECALEVHRPVAKDCNGDPIYIGGTVWYDNEKYLVHAYKRDDELGRLLCTCCDAWETPQWLYIDSDVTVRNPKAQLVDPRSSLDDAASALRALQDTLQKDVLSKLETVLESLSEVQKD